VGEKVKVGIVGIGHGKFGNRSDATVQELAFEPFKQAIEDTKNLRRLSRLSKRSRIQKTLDGRISMLWLSAQFQSTICNVRYQELSQNM